MTALLCASYEGHLPVVRELVTLYKADLCQKDKVCLTLSHALVTMHIFCHTAWFAYILIVEVLRFITYFVHAQACSNK